MNINAANSVWVVQAIVALSLIAGATVSEAQASSSSRRLRSSNWMLETQAICAY